MQMFILDDDFSLNAQYYVDRHVCKIQTEIAQLLSTCWHLTADRSLPDFIFKPTHENHPCSKWIRTSVDNYHWSINLGLALHDEYNYRYSGNGKYQRESQIFNWCKQNTPDLPLIGLTVFAQAMPEKYQQSNTIEAYRNYYRIEKAHLFKWKKRKQPYWIN